MTAPSGTPPLHRRRRRDLTGSPAAVLGMLMMANHGHLDPDLAGIACQVSRQTIIQSIHRLRQQGLVIHTHPVPPGPQRVQYYLLDDYSRPKAWELLHWWTEDAPETWSDYTHRVAKEENQP